MSRRFPSFEIASLGSISATLITLIAVSGCGENVKFNNPLAKKPAQTQATSKPAPAAKPAAPAAKPGPSKEELARRTMIRTESIRGGTSRFSSGKSVGANATVEENVDRLRTEIASSIDFAPTLIVWVVDATQSASEMRQSWSTAAKQLYSNFQTNGLPGGKASDSLSTAVVAFGEKTIILQDPTTDLPAVVSKVGTAFPTDNSGKENTFATLNQVFDTFGPIKQKESRELLVVVVSDEAGDDWMQVDAVTEKANALGARVYAIGVPAPLGRKRPEVAAQETRSDGMPAMLQGPETRYSQRVDMKFSSGGFGGDDVDSGYGPFSLGYLTNKTNGAFLISRLRSSQWPGSSMRFDDETMRKYPPQYLTEAQYQAKLAENKALAALDRAAQQGQVEAMTYPASQFIVEDEARLKNALDGAQRTAARLEPLVNAIYDPLAEGEKDRDKITDKRWQASYDLALGRAAAAKARTDGYNQMLAILKGGRKFEDPSHNTWKLEPADTLEEAGSRLEKTRLQAKEYLERVIKEHPDTPWAYYAEKELETPIGWKWAEY
ncbi:vWA domain-containing protein [Bremerella sp. JC817]|uniref:vWA domain-containing protein n=1 Tax=Bremerella sp. JC817 TaxID=3231756 RepID=UPI00345A2ADD